MIDVKIDDQMIQEIADQIGGMQYKSRRIFQQSLNQTAKEAVELERDGVRKRYAFTAGGKINLYEQIRKKSATYATPMSEILSQSTANRLSWFYITPRTLAHGAGRPKMYRGKVLREGSVKPVKGFMVRFKSGHEEFVHRIEGQTYRDGPAKAYREANHLDVTKIAPVYSPATPSMAGKAWVLEGVREETAKLLRVNVQKNIDKFLKMRDRV